MGRAGFGARMKQIDARLVAASPSVFNQIQEQGKLGGYELRSAERQLLVTNFFDTEEWDLLKGKAIMRLRRLGRACTLGLSIVARRKEVTKVIEDLEEPLPDGYPENINAVDGDIMGRIKTISRSRDLLVVLTIESNRTIIGVARNGEPRFEMVLNDVEFVGSRDQRRHFEMEIESTGGDAYELETLLGILTSGFALQASAETRFERGLRLMRAWPVGVKW